MCVRVPNWGGVTTLKFCKPVYCVCHHINKGHGPGGCSGETLRGAVWHGCKCEKFVKSEDQSYFQGGRKVVHRQTFGPYHQG